jgi:hypothetical protein
MGERAKFSYPFERKSSRGGLTSNKFKIKLLIIVDRVAEVNIKDQRSAASHLSKEILFVEKLYNMYKYYDGSFHKMIFEKSATRCEKL